VSKRLKAVVRMALPIAMLILAGCWDSTEVNDLAIITAAGLDLTEDQQVELSVKIYLISPSDTEQSNGMSESNGGGNGKSVIRAVRGKSFAQAASNLQQLLTRQVFWGQAQVFIFGADMAQHGLDELMDYLTRQPTIRERANVFISQTSAKEVLALDPPIERSVADALREMVRLQTGLGTTVLDLAQMMSGKSRTAIIPLVDILSESEYQQPFPHISGAAIVKNGKMIDQVDEKITMGIMWLMDIIKQKALTLEPQQGQHVSVQLLRGHSKLIPSIVNDRWEITAHIEALVEIIENTTERDYSIPDHLEQLEAELEEQVNQDINQALELAQQKWKADVYQFADVFYRAYPKVWDKNKDRWEEIFPQVEVKLDTNIIVKRPGMTGKNIFKPGQR